MWTVHAFFPQDGYSWLRCEGRHEVGLEWKDVLCRFEGEIVGQPGILVVYYT
jgi:hypothetical protein